MVEYSVEEVRARFESAFARKEGLNLFRLDGEYSSTPTRWAFASYQAAYADRIKADEGVVPVAWMWEQYYQHENAGQAKWHVAVEDYQGYEDCAPENVRNIQPLFTRPPVQAAQMDRDAYEGAREDLLDWKGRAQRAEATLRSLGYVGVDASQAPTVEPVAQGEAGERINKSAQRLFTTIMDITSGDYYESHGVDVRIAPWSALLCEANDLAGELSDALATQPRALPADFAEYLKDPANVHVMMLRGVIAIPSIRSIVHLRGEVPNGEDAQLARIAELQEQVAALKDKPAERVPDGWVLVPREATEEMVDRAWGSQHPKSVWELMLAAAPSPGES